MVSGCEKMFSEVQAIFLKAETMFSAVQTVVSTIKTMFFVIATPVGVTQALFREAEAIFYASQTGFSITKKTVGEMPAAFVHPLFRITKLAAKNPRQPIRGRPHSGLYEFGRAFQGPARFGR